MTKINDPNDPYDDINNNCETLVKAFHKFCLNQTADYNYFNNKCIFISYKLNKYCYDFDFDKIQKKPNLF